MAVQEGAFLALITYVAVSAYRHRPWTRLEGRQRTVLMWLIGISLGVCLRTDGLKQCSSQTTWCRWGSTTGPSGRSPTCSPAWGWRPTWSACGWSTCCSSTSTCSSPTCGTQLATQANHHPRVPGRAAVPLLPRPVALRQRPAGALHGRQIRAAAGWIPHCLIRLRLELYRDAVQHRGHRGAAGHDLPLPGAPQICTT